MPEYCHLHNHTQYSLLDGAGKIDRMVQKAADCGMKAVGISDHGNMYGVPEFVMAARKVGVKPIIGSEFYICEKELTLHEKSNRTFHQILIAKNDEGYRNLMRLSSIAYRDGFYYKPRIDKQTLAKHAGGLIATTCCLASEINQLLGAGHDKAAEELFRWYIELFGQDYYVELQDHGLGLQHKCNAVLLEWAKKYGVKTVATNDVHYIDQADSEPHDLLLALQTDADYYSENRFRFTDDNNKLNPQFYFKTGDEMADIFPEHPEALANTVEIADKCNLELDLTGDLILPVFKIPEGFETEDEYLAHLTWEGAKKKYGEITTDISERIERELGIIKQVGYAGYFLIVQEFTAEARKRGVYVGPGRGSAAGSVVAYAVGIIDVDPMTYSLLFERFLNPERVSPPDIDIDFDDEGREEVMNFVIEKYGRECVSQVVTFGTMGAKTAIRDVGRALGVPLHEVNRIARLIPDRPGVTFKKALDPAENPDHFEELKGAVESGDPKIADMMRYALSLEGTARHTGIHACAVIITPGELTDYVPLAFSKGKAVTQYEGPKAEQVGLLKMDFLGLKTLSILKTAVRLVKENHNVGIDIDHDIPLDDEKTYELYQKGETVATFQFESDGMRKYLRQLKPTKFEDLIAMNALYRPGPMDNIPSFINRKHGREQIHYPHPLLEPILENTYGIMVYQEQIMECARKLAGYSLGGADLLRRAMGKKKMDVMEKERVKFVEGAAGNDIPAEQAEEIFATMAKFASYGFNKSHSAAYSLVAFRTAYMKANYPEEYMAAVLSHNLDNIEKISFFIEECRSMGIQVLPPCANESQYLFSVNKDRQIRFGLGAIKGVGQSSAEAVIAEREAEGPFKSIFELSSRVPAKLLGKRTLESLVYSGALDNLAPGVNRSQYFHHHEHEEINAIEKAVQYGTRAQAEKQSAQASLFGGGDGGGGSDLSEPALPYAEPWADITRLNYEREVIGFYLSGHPLNMYRLEIDRFATCKLNEVEKFRDRDVTLAGIVTGVRERVTRSGSKFLIAALEDEAGVMEIALFRDDYAKYKGYMEINHCLFITASYKQAFRDAEKYELKVRNIEMLDGVLESRVKEIWIDCKLNQLSESVVNDLYENLSRHKGGCAVKFRVADAELNEYVSLQAKEIKARPSEELFKSIKIHNLQVRLN